ncbi:unnamed protein product [Schistocephalus solidus]|uniref:Retrotrans_gag domain-containing protein n=1 Tax=Schistocephalus solidus TaxID=70667 RepID=A0A183SLJ2_SCHSO|nr:unnamed protein product [Schistocephalus solidus]
MKILTSTPVSDPGASEPPVLTSYVHPHVEIESYFARSALRPPPLNPFHSGDDYSLWAQNFLRGVHLKAAGSYLVSLLEYSAVRQLTATVLSFDAPATALFNTSNDLFDPKQSASLALETFWRAFPDESPVWRKTEVIKEFTRGVRNTELYSKFFQKQYVYQEKALDVACGYEAAEVAQ